jgi:hypothetical protein
MQSLNYLLYLETRSNVLGLYTHALIFLAVTKYNPK